jgi:hypothetical protein
MPPVYELKQLSQLKPGTKFIWMEELYIKEDFKDTGCYNARDLRPKPHQWKNGLCFIRPESLVLIKN